MKNCRLFFSKNTIKFFTILVMMILLAGISLGPYSVFAFFNIKMLSNLGNYWQLFMFGNFYIVFIFFVFRREIVKMNDLKVSVFIFTFSFVLRTIVAFWYSPTPVSDFDFYYSVGEWFLQGDFSRIADRIAQYQIPAFGGLAVLNTVLTCLFSHTLIGQQIANAVMTSLACVCIFHIGKHFERKIGVAAAFIYSLYPSNIIMTQVCTNQHGASLMYLCAALCMINIKKHEELCKRFIWSVFAGLCLAVGYFFHPSAIIIVLTFLCCSFLYVIQGDRLELKRHIIDFFVFLITYIIIIQFSLFLLQGSGMISSTKSAPILPRIVVGLNHETMGQWSADDLQALANAEDHDRFAKKMIIERIKDPKMLLQLYWNKLNILMFGQDSSFMWYTYAEETDFLHIDAEDDLYEKKAEHYHWIKIFTESIARWDQYFVLLIYFFAVTGLSFCLFHNNHSQILLYILIEICGWIGVFVLAEVQPRYRYYIMPEIMICAAYGILNLGRVMRRYQQKLFGLIYSKCEKRGRS